MISISELSEELGIPYKRLNRWIHEFGLGQKVGWAVILTEAEAKKLKQLLVEKQKEGLGKPGRPLILDGAHHGSTTTA